MYVMCTPRLNILDQVAGKMLNYAILRFIILLPCLIGWKERLKTLVCPVGLVQYMFGSS